MYKISKEHMDALEASIIKWQNIINSTAFDNGAGNCALCIYNTKVTGNISTACAVCIIYMDTHQGGCKGTPYELWYKHQLYDYFANITGMCPECIKLAQAELDYLIDLKNKCIIKRG